MRDFSFLFLRRRSSLNLTGAGGGAINGGGARRLFFRRVETRRPVH